jgi:hypothetical protein
VNRNLKRDGSHGKEKNYESERKMNSSETPSLSARKAGIEQRNGGCLMGFCSVRNRRAAWANHMRANSNCCGKGGAKRRCPFLQKNSSGQAASGTLCLSKTWSSLFVLSLRQTSLSDRRFHCYSHKFLSSIWKTSISKMIGCPQFPCLVRTVTPAACQFHHEQNERTDLSLMDIFLWKNSIHNSAKSRFQSYLSVPFFSKNQHFFH